MSDIFVIFATSNNDVLDGVLRCLPWLRLYPCEPDSDNADVGMCRLVWWCEHRIWRYDCFFGVT